MELFIPLLLPAPNNYTSPQVCLLDLDYNLPVQVRDYALGLDNEDEPSSGVGKEYQLQRKVWIRLRGNLGTMRTPET